MEWGVVLPKNRSMPTLGKKLGFQMNQHPGPEKELETVISLATFDPLPIPREKFYPGPAADRWCSTVPFP
jgi:hypothetical protein